VFDSQAFLDMLLSHDLGQGMSIVEDTSLDRIRQVCSSDKA